MGNVLTSIQFPQQEKKSEQTSEFLKAAFAGATESIILMIENGQSVNCADVGRFRLVDFNSSFCCRNTDSRVSIGV